MGIMDAAFHSGIGTLDTAVGYGDAQSLIGRYMSETGNRFRVNTKFHSTAYTVREQLKTSLNALNCSSINVYFYHSFDDFVDNPKVKSDLLDLKVAGLIDKIGLSVYENYQFLAAINSDLIDVIQLPYNLLDNYSQRGELLRQAKDAGKVIHARSLFLQGLFWTDIESIPSKLAPLIPYLDQLNEIANYYSISPQQMAVGYLTQQAEIDEIVFGVDSIAQLKMNIPLFQEQLSATAIAAINHVKVKEIDLLYPKNW